MGTSRGGAHFARPLLHPIRLVHTCMRGMCCKEGCERADFAGHSKVKGTDYVNSTTHEVE